MEFGRTLAAAPLSAMIGCKKGLLLSYGYAYTNLSRAWKRTSVLYLSVLLPFILHGVHDLGKGLYSLTTHTGYVLADCVLNWEEKSCFIQGKRWRWVSSHLGAFVGTQLHWVFCCTNHCTEAACGCICPYMLVDSGVVTPNLRYIKPRNSFSSHTHS